MSASLAVRVPVAGAPVQRRRLLRAQGLLPAAQQVGEKLVVAVPALLVVQGDKEEVVVIL